MLVTGDMCMCGLSLCLQNSTFIRRLPILKFNEEFMYGRLRDERYFYIISYTMFFHNFYLKIRLKSHVAL